MDTRQSCKHYQKGGLCNSPDAPNPGHSRCIGKRCEEYPALGKDESFQLGYRNAIEGHVTRELTSREIAAEWPYVDVECFAQGVIDGLAGDSHRYDLSRHHIAYC